MTFSADLSLTFEPPTLQEGDRTHKSLGSLVLASERRRRLPMSQGNLSLTMRCGGLCVLVLLTGYTLAQQDSDQTDHLCLMASRFKPQRKYLYQYTSESRNGVVGTANLRNGPKVSCQVEIEVPQTCRFIMHTRDCTLSEVSLIDADGQPVYMPAAGQEAFQAAMAKNPLKFSAEPTNVHLFPAPEETTNILNIKRGIVSSLMVPALEQDQTSLMSTVHGQCLTKYEVNARKDIAVDVTLVRQLSQCDQFHSREAAASPLALLQKLHRPLSNLIESSQKCNYRFDHKGKHITMAMCTETHSYIPFSHKDSGISSVVSQELSFQSTRRIYNREFDVRPSHKRSLHFEDPDDKAPVQTKDAALSTMKELQALAGSDQGQKRTSLFHKLVSSLRTLKNETLSETVKEMMESSVWLTWQAMLQCGTSECTSAILQSIWALEGVSLEADALVYGLSLQPKSNAARVRDMLSMAQYKQSKAIMYALANTVKKFYKGKVTPEILEVSTFMEQLLNDCSLESAFQSDGNFPPDREETAFLVLRVVGVMGEAMQAASPGLIASIMKCAKKPNVPSSIQKSAVQALRLMDVNDEVKRHLMEVFRNDQVPVENRIAAYLILIKNPDLNVIREFLSSLGNERDDQLKNFVVSHLRNIQNSKEHQLQPIIEFIASSLNDQPQNKIFGMSRNFKSDLPLGSVQSNVIFDSTNTLPKELMLETTLKVFDYNDNVFEVGIEGTGFQPTIDALFGKNGFFPDAVSRALYWADDRAQMLQDVVKRVTPEGAWMKRQVPQNLLKDLSGSVEKLMKELRSSPVPEATAFLRILGNEVGYMKTSEMRKMVDALTLYFHLFFRILPAEAFLALTSSTDNQVFAHYIFMENGFSLPTASGLPLKFSLAGVFAPGAKGGVSFSVNKGALSFMPSVGLELITQMGVHVPEYVDSGLQMHTNIYHESSINAKIAISSNQIKFSIPAPKSNTQLFSVNNKVLSISAGQAQIVPSLVEDRTDATDCRPFVSGLNICTIIRYSNATFIDQAPYYPLTGETTAAIELQPTGVVSEYSATLTQEAIREGKELRRKAESVKLTLKAQGDDSSEATVSLKYNRNKSVITSEIYVPKLGIETVIRFNTMNVVDQQNTMRGATLDVANKNIPQLKLVCNIKTESTSVAMVQLQMQVPSLKTEALASATLQLENDMVIILDSAVKLPETSYNQRASLKYDEDKIEVELKSDFESAIQKLIPNADARQRHLQNLMDDFLDQTVTKTDMKLRHIVSKGIEAAHIWLEKLMVNGARGVNLRHKRGLSDLTLPSLPEKLYLHTHKLFRYQFNKDKNRRSISLQLPLGGKSSEEINFPRTLSIPAINLPQIGLRIPPLRRPLPSFTIPPSLDISVPNLGMAEVAAKIDSNLYSWEGSVSGANNTVDFPSYSAQFKAMAKSPCQLLDYKLEGTGMLSDKADNIRYGLNVLFSHSLLDMSFSATEGAISTDKARARANYRFQASSPPIGFQASLLYSAKSTADFDLVEISGDGTIDGMLKIGPLQANTLYAHNYVVHPLDKEGRGESTLQFNSPPIQINNKIEGAYANSALKIISKTNTNDDLFSHEAELGYKDSQVTLKCNAVAKVLDQVLNNKAEFGLSKHMALVRIESHAGDESSHGHSLFVGSLGSSGLELHSEGSFITNTDRALHKASVVLNRSGLMTSGSNNIQCSLLTLENIFNGEVSRNGAALSCKTKVAAEENAGELIIEGKITPSEASIHGSLHGNVNGAGSRNNAKLQLDKRGLFLSANNIGTVGQLKTESSHSLDITLWTLTLQSRSDNFICDDVYYKHNARVVAKPFLVRMDGSNELRVYDGMLGSEGHVKLEPVKMELGGSVKGNYGKEYTFKHSFDFNYDNLEAAVRSATFGTAVVSQLSQTCELGIAGMSFKSNCEGSIKSKPVRLNARIRTMAEPFSFTVDALINGDAEIGLHSGQMYNKILLKAQPVALAYAHDSGISISLQPPSGPPSVTLLESKLNGHLSPLDQALMWKVQSKLKNHAYSQDLSALNNPELTKLQLSGVILTDLFSRTEVQEFSASGLLQYDKNSECHIIQIPFIENVPVFFEHLKANVVQTLEELQRFINSLNIDAFIANFKANVNNFPTKVGNVMKDLRLQDRVNAVKKQLDFLMDRFSISMQDLENAVYKMRRNLEATVLDVAAALKNLVATVRDYVMKGHLNKKISDTIASVGNELQAFNENYSVKKTLLRGLNALEDIIRKVNLQKTDGSTWLQELNLKYGILDFISEQIAAIKQAIAHFDINRIFSKIENYIVSVDLSTFVEQFSFQIPTAKISNIIESMSDVIVNWIDEYEIPNKFNAVYFYVRDLLKKYNVDQKFKDIMDKTVILINDFKVKETVQVLSDALSSINLEYVHDAVIQSLRRVQSQLKDIDFKRSIKALNEYLSSLLRSVREFDYDAFVDEANKKTAELINHVNQQIVAYEIVQKIEAFRDYVRTVQNAVYKYLDKLKLTKVADALKNLKQVIDTTIYHDVKMKLQDILQDARERILNMDVRKEIYIHLRRISDSYRNIVNSASADINSLMEAIGKKVGDTHVFSNIRQAVRDLLQALKRAEIHIPPLAIPLTDLTIPRFTIDLNKLSEINIPTEFTTPEFTVLGSYTVPAVTVSLDEIKAKMIRFIDRIRGFEMPAIDPEDIFGDLKVLYMFDLPDFTVPEISLREIKLPAPVIPKLKVDNFEITMLPIPEFKFPEIPSDICVPVFGNLHGVFTVNSPIYVVETTLKIENSTSFANHPKFTAALTSQANSLFPALQHNLEAMAQLEAPQMKKLQFGEMVKVVHPFFSVDHEGSLMLTEASADASARTIAKATTRIYAADLVNDIAISLKKGISATMNTVYNHNVDIAPIETSSLASLKQNVKVILESDTISVTGETTANGKLAVRDYYDEGAHRSNIGFDLNFQTAKLTFEAETNCQSLKSKQTLMAESVFLSHLNVDAQSEMELPFVKKSVAVVRGEARVEDLKVALAAKHNAELMSGSMSNSLEFIAKPFEIGLDVTNNVNMKAQFPMKLTGRIDLQNDYSVTLNAKKQGLTWLTLARFNQYKYKHNITAENTEAEIFLHTLANGEANLEFLTVPISIPEMTVPYMEVRTPRVRDLSLWENAGLKDLLSSPQQSFDMYLKLHYYKNPEMYSIKLPLKPVYNAIRDKSNLFKEAFAALRDRVVALLRASYQQAKSQYRKHKIDMSSQPPRILTVPGYKIPLLNVEVSSFSAEMPAFSYIVPKDVSTPGFKFPALGFSVPSYTLVLPSLQFPAIHVPESLSEITFPTFRLPDMQNGVLIPALGNMTGEFSFKSSVINLGANVAVQNQPDYVARFGASAVSVFEILNGKIDGSTSFTLKRGLKLASDMAVEHIHFKGNHFCSLILNRRVLDTSVINKAQIDLPNLNVELNQEFSGNTKNKPNISSKKKIKYMFKIPLIDTAGKGNLDVHWELEDLFSYVSLEATVLGKSDVTFPDNVNFAGDFKQDANLFFDANHLRSTLSTVINVDTERHNRQRRSTDSNVFHFDLTEDLAFEVSLRRVFAKLDFTSTNDIDVLLDTYGKHTVKGEFDYVPLSNLKSRINVDAIQPCGGSSNAVLVNMDLIMGWEKQSLFLSSKEELASLVHAGTLYLSNDETEIRLDLSSSVEGHLAFLKRAALPVYRTRIWDVLKLDEVTDVDNTQALNISTSVIYTKSMDGTEYRLPSMLLKDGVKFSLPEIKIPIPSRIRKVLHYTDESEKTDYITLPPAVSVPAFKVPFTDINVEPFTLDPKNLNIPNEITTAPFKIKLPGLPLMSVPSLQMEAEYFQQKTPFLSLKIPRYEISVDSFSLPKSVNIAGQMVSLDNVMSDASNIELPNITIQKQKIQIPGITLHLPSSIFIPHFGALSASMKVSSPVYNMSVTAGVETKGSGLVTQLNSACSSTITFLQYDLTGTATLDFSDGFFSLHGKCAFVHNDVKMDWQHVFAQNLRFKRQTLPDSKSSYHTLNIDISSPTFADANFRFASRKDGVIASVSSPSSGFLGMLLQRRSPTLLYGKLFGRYLASPEKDADVFTAKATLRDPQKLVLNTAWELDILHHVIEGTKDRVPAVSEALLSCINKYHVEHFGFDVQQGGNKIKRAILRSIDGTFYESPITAESLRNFVTSVCKHAKIWYMKASNLLMSLNLQEAIRNLDKLVDDAVEGATNKIRGLLDRLSSFLRNIRVTLPGSKEKMSALEVIHHVHGVVKKIVDQAVLRFQKFQARLRESTRHIQFNIFGIDVQVRGDEVEEKVKQVYREVTGPLAMLLYGGALRLERIFRTAVEKAQNLIDFLSEKNKNLAPKVDQLCSEAIKKSIRDIEEARRDVVTFKNHMKATVQEIFDSLTVDHLNNNTVEVIDVFQSHLYGGLNEYIDLVRRASHSAEPYVRMTNKKMDVEVPLPFLWRSFSEWPTAGLIRSSEEEM
ncbi:apolipoprotein B-100 isoform 1-T1 [Synchiropus picturatus]